VKQYLYIKNKKMKRTREFMLVTAFVTAFANADAQRNVAEATIVYDMVIQTGNGTSKSGDALTGATTTVYVKGNNSRTDMASTLGKETTIYNSKTGNAVILKEFSGQKLMITLTRENWIAKNKMYNNVKFELTGETKTIAGYNTQKAIARMADGKTFEVYYTPELVLTNKEYDLTFSNLPGLAIQYEIESGKMKFQYTLAKINYDPVQVSLFDFPTSGYRTMTYEENQNLKKGN
jgi:GLPGLI family protein